MLGVVGAIVFVPGLIVGLLLPGAPLLERAICALMPAGLAFIAALLLAGRDRILRSSAIRAVRATLATRYDVGDAEVTTAFPDVDPTLLAQTRNAIGLFFDVPASRIHPTDDLRRDLSFGALEPQCHGFVISHVLSIRNVASPDFMFKTQDLRSIGQFAGEIQRILDRCDGTLS
jgi:hypothetical protein